MSLSDLLGSENGYVFTPYPSSRQDMSIGSNEIGASTRLGRRQKWRLLSVGRGANFGTSAGSESVLFLLGFYLFQTFEGGEMAMFLHLTHHHVKTCPQVQTELGLEVL